MQSTQKDSIYYLEKAPISQAIIHMALPMILSMVLDLVYNLIDAFFIGRLGNTAMLASVTLAFPILIVLMGVGQIFGVGGGTLIPRLLGEKNFEGAKKASSVNFYLSLISGIIISLVLLPLLSPILKLLGATGETYQYTKDFLTVFAIGSPLVITSLALAETIRGEGSSTASMTGMILSVVVNILLDPLLINVFKLNVTGAALATVIANGVSLIYFIWFIKNKSLAQSINLKDFRPSKEILANIFKIGSSAFIFSALMVVASMMFNTYAIRYGDNVLAAFGVANRITQIVEMLGAGLFTGIVPLIAYAYAAGDSERLNKIITTVIMYFLLITLVIGGLLLGFRQPILSLFSRDPGVLEAGKVILTAMLISTLFTGFTSIFTDMFQAFGAGTQSNIMALLRGLALIPIIILGNALFGITGVIWSLPAAEILSCLVGLVVWTASGKKLLSIPLEKRQALAVEMG